MALPFSWELQPVMDELCNILQHVLVGVTRARNDDVAG